MTDIRHDLELPISPNALHQAITTKAGIEGWWSKDCEIASDVGGTHELRFVKGDRTVVMRFRVDEISPNRVAWTCTDNGNPVWVDTTLTFSITARGDGSVLTLDHRGFKEDASPPYRMTVEGWGHVMQSLRAYAEAGQGQPI
jgi:uncharacterized protein YndB with AHSA1/START domain